MAIVLVELELVVLNDMRPAGVIVKIVVVMKYLLVIVLVLNTIFFVVGSSNLNEHESDSDQKPPEKLPLVRQTNSPSSQLALNRLASTQRSRRNSQEEGTQKITLDDAWLIFQEEGDKGPLMEILNRAGFDGNVFVFGSRTLLIMAILSEDVELVRRILQIPEIDVNSCWNSAFLPIEHAFANPEMFNLFMTEAPGLNLLKQNAFGINAIQQAIREGRFDYADRMLSKIRLYWSDLKSDERNEVLELQKELVDARAGKVIIRKLPHEGGKIKID